MNNLNIYLDSFPYLRSYCHAFLNNSIRNATIVTKICVEKKNHLDVTECFITLIYDMFNMFRALLCPSSRTRDYMCVTTAYGVQCLVAGCRGSDAGQQAVRPGREMLHDSVVHFLDALHAALHLNPDNQQTKHRTP